MIQPLLSRESKSFERRLHTNKLKMPPQGRCCQESRSCLSNKDMPKRPSVSINTSSACECDFLPWSVSGDMRDGYQV